jgi:hypothetical protein
MIYGSYEHSKIEINEQESYIMEKGAKMKQTKRKSVSNDVSPIIKGLLLLLVLILLPIIVIGGVFYHLWGLTLSVLIWIVWGTSGRYILFVHSDSPIWSEYIEQEILPHIQGKAVILNWSERKTWKPSLAVWAFHYFGGRRSFNPMAIVFRPFRLHGTFRFYEAFQDYKHGSFERLIKLKADFFGAIEK